MTDTMSITIPLTHVALSNAATMFTNMANDLVTNTPPSGFVTVKEAEQMVLDGSDVVDNNHIEKTIPVSQGGLMLDEPDASFVFSKNTPASPDGMDASNIPHYDAPVKSPAPSVGENQQTNVESNVSPNISPTTVESKPLNMVELDSDNLPWDARIHSLGAKGEHNKTVKDGKWKKKRGIESKSPGLVEQVEAELRAVMAIPATTTVDTPAPALANTNPVPPAETMTFPVLMGHITAAGIVQETLDVALGEVGLASVVMLNSRPDLIPAVAAKIGITA